MVNGKGWKKALVDAVLGASKTAEKAMVSMGKVLGCRIDQTRDILDFIDNVSTLVSWNRSIPSPVFIPGGALGGVRADLVRLLSDSDQSGTGNATRHFSPAGSA